MRIIKMAIIFLLVLKDTEQLSLLLRNEPGRHRENKIYGKDLTEMMICLTDIKDN